MSSPSRRLPDLPLGDSLEAPDYEGGSILNLPAGVCRWLGVPTLGASPLRSEIVAPLGSDYQRVILILMDALAFHRLQRWMQARPGSAWHTLAERGVLTPLTSIVPSTTSAALTTLWTGRSPQQHGIVGYELWLKEYGIVANTVSHKPIAFEGQAGALEYAGFKPEEALPFPTLGTHLAAHGVSTYVMQPRAIAHSSLSRMLFRDTHNRFFFTAADLWVNLRRLIQARPAERQYVWVYWSEIDTLGHFYGPDDERTEAEFAAFGQALQTLFLEQLDPALRAGTLLALTADHGQIATQPDPHYDLRNHPSLARRLHLLPSGEHRLTYLFVRPGQMEAVREYIQRTWPNQFTVLESAYAVEAGLFGPGAAHPRLSDRIGDLILLARGSAYLWWEDRDNRLYGRHGGLHPEEMRVPLLDARL
jgi:hypothetical protein